MSLTGFIILLVIAAICGSLGQTLAGYSLGGCLVSIVIGFIGAYIGYWIAGQFNLPLIFAVNIDGQQFPVIWAIIGSALFALVVGMITRRRAYI